MSLPSIARIKNQKSIFSLLEGDAGCFGIGSGKDGADRNFARRAIGLSVMVDTILNLTGNALNVLYALAAAGVVIFIFDFIHLYLFSFS